jgi:hypothetical protein
MIGVLILATWVYALVQRSRDGRLASKMAKAGQWDHLDNELARRHARSVARTESLMGIRQRRRDRVAGGPAGPPPSGWRAYRDEIVADFWLDRLEAHRRRRAARGQPAEQDGTSWLERTAERTKRAARLLIEPVGGDPKPPAPDPDPVPQSWQWQCTNCQEQITRHSQADIDAAATAHQCPTNAETPPPPNADPVATPTKDSTPTCPNCLNPKTPTWPHGGEGDPKCVVYVCTTCQPRKPQTPNPPTSTGATMDHTTTPTGEAAGILSGGEQAQAIQSSTHRFREQANAALEGFSKALETLENSARAMGLDDRSDIVKTILACREAIASQVATVASTCEQVVSAMAAVAAAFGKQGNIAEQRAVVGQVAHDSAYDN